MKKQPFLQQKPRWRHKDNAGTFSFFYYTYSQFWEHILDGFFNTFIAIWAINLTGDGSSSYKLNKKTPLINFHNSRVLFYYCFALDKNMVKFYFQMTSQPSSVGSAYKNANEIRFCIWIFMLTSVNILAYLCVFSKRKNHCKKYRINSDNSWVNFKIKRVQSSITAIMAKILISNT